MKTLIIEFTDGQYNRFKAAMQKLTNEEIEITDDMLVAQMKREASAITCAAETGHTVENWSF